MPDAIRPRRAVLTLALWLCGAGSLAAQGERRFDDGALKPLAEALGATFAAREMGSGGAEARAAVAQRLAGLAARAEGGHPLALAADLGRAAWLARAYPDERRRRGKVLEERFEGGSFGAAGFSYALRLPDDYDPSKGSYPLIVAIPDHDEAPAEHLRTYWTDPLFRRGAIVVVPVMPGDRERWTKVMVRGRPGGLTHVLTARRVAAERYAVDFERIFLAGRGKGVPAAVAAGSFGPQLFAGIVARAGDPDPLDATGADNFTNLPTLFLGGGANARAFQEAAQALGNDLCTLDPAGGEARVWSWMQANPRRSHPTSVVVRPGDPFPTRAYWMRVAATAPDVRVEARIDRAANSVHITSRGASRAILYLNDALLDLDRPIRIVEGGFERDLRATRHLPTALDLLVEGTSDPGCFYTAELLVDLGGSVAGGPAPPSPALDRDFLRQLAEAGSDASALWRLHEAFAAVGFEEHARSALRRLVRLHPDHVRGRAALGHERSGTHWFTRAESRAAFERRQDAAFAAGRGYVQHGGQWMHPADRAQSARGLTRDPDSGLWLGASERRRLSEGWVLQDEEWIAPEEAGQRDLGLWKVDGEWLELAAANRRRARPEAPWRIPGPLVRVIATVDRDVALRARIEMERALDELVRLFGVEPQLPLEVLVLRDEEQYDLFAFGAPDGRRPPASASRLHFVHSAFLAESWFERVDRQLQYRGAGVCYYDPFFPHGERYGVHSARLALGFSFVEALDPSPKAVRRALTNNGPGADFLQAFLAEKQLPAWLRYGGPVYAERYYRDPSVIEGGDPFWTRRWSLENLAAAGGWRGMAEVLAFPLDADDRAGARKLLIEAGLVVAFVLDGGCAPVAEAHSRLRTRIAAGRASRSDFAALETALLASEAELRAFAGF